MKPKLIAINQQHKKKMTPTDRRKEIEITSIEPVSVSQTPATATINTSATASPSRNPEVQSLNSTPHLLSTVIAERDEARGTVLSLQKVIADLQAKVLSYQVDEEEWESERSELRGVIGTLAAQRDELQAQLNLLNHLWAQNEK